MVRFHPIAVEQKVSIHVEVAGRIAVDFRSKRLFDLFSIEVFGNQSKLGIAKVFGILASFTDVVHILPRPLIWTHQRVIAIDRRRDTRPNAFACIAAGDERLAARKCIIHSLTGALVEDGRPTALSTRHGPVICILSQSVGETVPDQNRFQIDISMLVTQDFRRKHGNVMAGV